MIIVVNLMHKIYSPEWEKVSPPSGWTWNLPFTIQKRGKKFRPDPAFSLQNRAGITVTKTYYVSKANGNNNNTGLDWDHPFRDPKTAWGKPDVDRVIISDGKFYYSELIPLPTRSIEIISTGAPGAVIFSSDLGDKASVFTLVDNHYEATFSGSSFVTSIRDALYLNSYGWPTSLALKTSIAEVDATPNSYYYIYGSTSNLYIRLSDDRVPDTNIWYLGSSAWSCTKDNIRFYLKNIRFTNCLNRNNSVTGGLKIYMEDCEFMNGITTHGVDEAIYKNCIWKTGGDGNNIDWRNNVVSNVIEIDCNYTNSSTAGDAQGSTGHNGCNIVRLNCVAHEMSGQGYADVLGCHSWLLGCESSGSRIAKVGYYTEHDMWLDCCWSHDHIAPGTDLQNTGGATIYIRNFIGGHGVNSIAGTLTTY